MTDPTYIISEINANPVWKLAFIMSEMDNDHAPIGWGRYIVLSALMLSKYDITEKTK